MSLRKLERKEAPLTVSPLVSVGKGLSTEIIGRRLLHYSCLPSTMDMARDLARAGEAEGTVVVADEQTAGRGRLGRSWLSPAGSSLALSVILRPASRHLSSLTMLAALATARCLEKVLGLHPAIKWPNDVLLRGKKVCGILIESEILGENSALAILGLGLNVNLDTTRYPEIVATATSLSFEVGHEVSRPEVFRGLLVEMDRLYSFLRHGGSLLEEWRARLETLGKRVRVGLGGGVIEEGLAEGVDDRGSLLLRQGDGRLITIVAGDVTLRPDS